MNNGWQAAVVDWDRAKAWYEKLELDSIVKIIDKKKDFTIKSGELCWIANVDVEDIDHIERMTKIKMAYIWRHDKQEYAYVILEALHPLVSEKDIVEMSMKFNEDYGEKIK